jgi:thioredoxin reductase
LSRSRRTAPRIATTTTTIIDAGGETDRRTVRAPFVCIGGKPRTGGAADTGVRTDGAGYVLTGPDLLKQGCPEVPLPHKGERARALPLRWRNRR